MLITTTDGKTYLIPIQCSYCNLSTGGQHESTCPLYPSSLPSEMTVGSIDRGIKNEVLG